MDLPISLTTHGGDLCTAQVALSQRFMNEV
jgi:hypothetical protein